jgi:hypothetical protein
MAPAPRFPMKRFPPRCAVGSRDSSNICVNSTRILPTATARSRNRRTTIRAHNASPT